MDDSKTPEPAFKFVLFGARGSGKSAIRGDFINGNYNHADPYVAPIFWLKRLELDGVKRQIELWEEPALSSLASIPTILSRGAVALIFVFDVTKKSSLTSIGPQIRLAVDLLPPRIVMIVGNKIDEPTREVSMEEGDQFARSYSALYTEVSAKTGSGVTEAFKTCLKAALEQQELMEHIESRERGQALKKAQPVPSSSCSC